MAGPLEKMFWTSDLGLARTGSGNTSSGRKGREGVCLFGMALDLEGTMQKKTSWAAVVFIINLSPTNQRVFSGAKYFQNRLVSELSRYHTPHQAAESLPWRMVLAGHFLFFFNTGPIK
jgi:hypothetical protein